MTNLPDEDCPCGGKHQPLAAGDANDGGPIHCYKCQAMLRSGRADNLPDERRAAIAEVLTEHEWFTPRGYAWPCCDCGEEFPDGEEAARAHVADALAPMLAGWLAEDEARALREFADTRGVNVGDEDDDWWKGYRQAQRECLHDATERAARIARNYRQENADGEL